MTSAYTLIDNLIRRGLCLFIRPFHTPDLQTYSRGNDFPDKHFLVIRRFAPSNAGLLSFVMTTIGWIRYAEKHGLTPVVDMQTWLNQCLDWWEIGRKNAWEFYFEQPAGFSLADIRHAKHITIANATLAPDHVRLLDLITSDTLTQKIRLLVKKYIRIKEDSLCQFENSELEAALNTPGSRVIGIRARGTDYNTVQPAGHAIQPCAKDFLKHLSTLKTYEKIYLASEDTSIINPLKRALGSKLILAKQSIPDYSGGWMPNCRVKGYSRRKEGAGYLKAIADLSRCPILLAGQNNGTAIAYLLSNGFEKFDLIQLGNYPS